MNLNVKFNLVLLGALAVGLVVTGVLSWAILERSARQEISERAGLMMEAALAVRGYTIDEIAPLLRPHMTETFLPQTVPAYGATQAFENLRRRHPDYAYKEATLNPTNPRDRTVDWEHDIVMHFRNHPEVGETMGVRDTPNGRTLYIARPIQIKSEACLACHSVPEVAPASMIAAYGTANGFGWQLDEIVGAQIVTVPMSVPLDRARRTFFTFMAALAAVFVVAAAILNLLLSRLVIRPVTRLSDMADQVSQGRFEIDEPTPVGDDELATLTRSFNRMRRSLEKALKLLEG